jgi:polyisoprenoid-binding protein YceI
MQLQLALRLTLALCLGICASCSTQATPNVQPTQTHSVNTTATAPSQLPTSDAVSQSVLFEGTRYFAIDQRRSSAQYQVVERFSGVALPLDVIGISNAISGQFAIQARNDSTVLNTMIVTVNLQSLASGDADRDRQMRVRWLETDAFQVAVFKSNGAHTLPSNDEADGIAISGTLTVRDISRTITPTVSARLIDGQVRGSATFRIRMSDFGIAPPEIADVLTVDDEVFVTTQIAASDLSLLVPNIVVTPTPAHGNQAVKFPNNYQSRFIHYATISRPDALRKVYISRDALKALRTGQSLPNGSEIVMEAYEKDVRLPIILLRRKTDQSTSQTLPAGLYNENWQYVEYNSERPQSSVVDGQTCHACHTGAKDADYMFTLVELQAMATTGQLQSVACNRLSRRPCNH